ncbi:DUF551 domain-containing protein [uncultured Muribaculum sp.]|uniref:DUF551 domain-containing protein n=1 Tax=uncultured Muribaculum sp. TaxID=1918613 RepID=UPI0025B4216F|nr:DUF551 domain-containing protein [uncultured Muribaculum sp.]
MNPTKDQQAHQYADAKVKENYGSESNFEWLHIKQAFEDGYTACEQSMWRSVEEELPEEGQRVFFALYGAFNTQKLQGIYSGFYSVENGFCDCIGYYGENSGNVTHWKPASKPH